MHIYVFLFQTILWSAMLLRCTIVLQFVLKFVYMHVHNAMYENAREIVDIMQMPIPMIGEVKVFQRKNMFYVHPLVCSSNGTLNNNSTVILNTDQYQVCEYECNFKDILT